MFVGHYGVSFAAKKADDSVPLWVLFLAVQLLDVVWAPLVLLGGVGQLRREHTPRTERRRHRAVASSQ